MPLGVRLLVQVALTKPRLQLNCNILSMNTRIRREM